MTSSTFNDPEWCHVDPPEGVTMGALGRAATDALTLSVDLDDINDTFRERLDAYKMCLPRHHTSASWKVVEDPVLGYNVVPSYAPLGFGISKDPVTAEYVANEGGVEVARDLTVLSTLLAYEKKKLEQQ